MRISRTDRSLLADWWFTVDRVLLAAILALVCTGLVLSLAASPAVAVKKGLAAFHFVERHLLFALLGVGAMLFVSLLSPRAVRRFSLLLFAGAVAVMIHVLMLGEEINGARRWLRLAGLSLQPSEFAKPAFVVLAAWAFAESEKRTDVPALPLAALFLVMLAVPLAMQPDVGQTLLVSLVWGALFFLTGRPIAWAGALVAAGGIATGVAYAVLPHVRGRIDRFLNPTAGDNSQTDRAFQSFAEGGFFGRGPGEGTIKTILPDAHTDFIFAVVAEEYGVLACLALVALYAFIVLRALLRMGRESDPFLRHAMTGLALLFGLQALINMAVNVGLIPAKGMTLPFISAGGSSTLAISITCGMLLALSRRRADPSRLKLPGLAANAGSLGPLGTETP